MRRRPGGRLSVAGSCLYTASSSTWWARVARELSGPRRKNRKDPILTKVGIIICVLRTRHADVPVPVSGGSCVWVERISDAFLQRLAVAPLEKHQKQTDTKERRSKSGRTRGCVWRGKKDSGGRSRGPKSRVRNRSQKTREKKEEDDDDDGRREGREEWSACRCSKVSP